MKKRKWMSMILVCALALQTSPTSFVSASETYSVSNTSVANASVNAFVTTAREEYVKPEYADYTTSIIRQYAVVGDDIPGGIELTWPTIHDAESYVVMIADNEGFQNSAELPSDYNSLRIFNLYTDTTYYWKVKATGGDYGAVQNFTTDNTVRQIWVEGARNVRDIGGWNGLNQGLVYRGTELNRVSTHNLELTPRGRKTLKTDLKIKTDLDFRGTGIDEDGLIQESPIGDSTTLKKISIGNYINAFAEDNKYADVLKVFADIDNYPIYMHCWGGADRTGTVAFLIEALCGATEEDLAIDFELTSYSNLGTRPRNDEGSFLYATMLSKLKEYEGETLQAKAENYAKNFLGLTDIEIENIQTILTDDQYDQLALGGYATDEATENTNEDTKIDFTGWNGERVSGFNDGYSYWDIQDNTYKPYKDYATTIFKKDVDFGEEKSIHEVSFKFKTIDKFRFGFVKNITDENQYESLIALIDPNGGYISFSDYTSSGGTEYKKITSECDASKEHNCKIVTRNRKAIFYIDGIYQYSYSIPEGANCIIFQMVSKDGYIDDFCITKKNAENHIYLDFETQEEAVCVDELYNGWRQDDVSVHGQIMPNSIYASAYMNQPLTFVQEGKTIIVRMSMYVAETSFVVSLMSDTQLISGKQSRLSGQLVFAEDGVTYRTTTEDGDVDYGNYHKVCDENYIHSKVDLEIAVANGQVDFKINGTQCETRYDLPVTAQYLGWQCGEGTDSRVDRISIDIKEDPFSNSFTGLYRNWDLLNGIYRPHTEYASTRGQHSIVADMRNTVSFDVKTTGEFNFALADNIVMEGNLVNGIVMHCINGSIVFNDNISDRLGAFATVHMSIADGDTHRITIRVEDKYATFYIDGEQVFSRVLDYDNYIPVFQLAQKTDYIDNYMVTKTEEVQVLEKSIEVGKQEVFLGWNVVGGGYDGLYLPGSIVPASEDIQVEPIVTEFYMTTGASARLASEAGLRWETRIKYSDYEELQSVNVDVQYGTIITSNGSEEQVDIPVVESGYRSGDDFVWRGALVSIKSANYERVLLGTGYIKVAYANGDEITISAITSDNERTYCAVIEEAYLDVKNEADDTYKTPVNVNGGVKYTYLSEDDFKTLTEIYNIIIQ